MRTISEKQKIGQLGEKIAEKYLKSKDYQIVEKNFWTKSEGKKLAEIDIIAKKGKKIVFFEVKTLSKQQTISPEEKINFYKLQKIQKAAQIWMEKNKQYKSFNPQIDVLAIVLDFVQRTARIKHFQNV